MMISPSEFSIPDTGLFFPNFYDENRLSQTYVSWSNKALFKIELKILKNKYKKSPYTRFRVPEGLPPACFPAFSFIATLLE